MEKSHPIVKATGQIERFMSEDRVRASVVEITDLCQEASVMQKTSPSSSIALSRILVSTALLASHTKEDHEVAVQISCKGPLKSLFAHCSHSGNLRGSVGEPNTTPSLVDGKFSLKPLVGEGFLTVTTHIPKARAPRKSQVELMSGEIGEDITHYLHSSMQIKSLLSLGVQVDSSGQVQAAGGVLIELMPGHSPETIEIIEKAHKMSEPLSDLIKNKTPFVDLLKNHSGNIEYAKMATETINYICSCEREKAAASIELLGLEELGDVVKAKEPLNINCDMCGLQ